MFRGDTPSDEPGTRPSCLHPLHLADERHWLMTTTVKGREDTLDTDHYGVSPPSDGRQYRLGHDHNSVGLEPGLQHTLDDNGNTVG